MGLLDVLNGIKNGPHGERDPSYSGGGMSPLTMAILALLAYKTVKHIGGSQPSASPASIPPNSTTPPNTSPANTGGGGLLDDLMKSPLGSALGGLLAGGAAGSVLSGGLNDLLRQFQHSGQAETMNSWLSTGPNKEISPNDLASALGTDQIDTLTAQTGMSRDDLLTGLSRQLPDVINELTPDGRVPTEQEASRWL